MIRGGGLRGLRVCVFRDGGRPQQLRLALQTFPAFAFRVYGHLLPSCFGFRIHPESDAG